MQNTRKAQEEHNVKETFLLQFEWMTGAIMQLDV